MILIPTELDGLHADHVTHKLRQRGAGLVMFTPAQFPAQAEVSLSYDVTGQA
jgi:hypothetical protein